MKTRKQTLLNKNNATGIKPGEDVRRVKLFAFNHSVGDPDPDPQVPHIFGPSGSGSISHRYGNNDCKIKF
jgi:hypothetical protein